MEALQEQEDFIMDTTAGVTVAERCVANLDDSDSETTPSKCTTCGGGFLESDRDVSITLQKCATCFNVIRGELIRQDNIFAIGSSFAGAASDTGLADGTTPLTSDGTTPLTSDGTTPLTSDGTTELISDGTTPLTSDSTTELNSDGTTPLTTDGTTPLTSDGTTPPTLGARAPVDMELVSGLMMSAVSDRSHMFSLILNGQLETFILEPDPLSSSNSRKLFSRASWSHGLLYSRDMYGGICSSKTAAVTPCVVVDKKGGKHVLMAFGKTLCNRPRLDGLIISLDTFEATFVQQIIHFVKYYLFNEPFDGQRMDR